MLARTKTQGEQHVSIQPQSLLRFLTCGSVDDGKSTLIGRLLYECGAVLDDQMVALESDSKKFGTDGGNIDFALLLDGLSAEREQGITIDVAYRYFSTPHRAFIVADTPGHEQYTRNMATGASTADLAIVLVDARNGILMQTRRHLFIAAMLRVPHVMLAVNKMDMTGYDQSVFTAIESQFRQIAAKLRFQSVSAIPLSARSGDNVVRISSAMPWYSGPSLLDFLETLDCNPGNYREQGFALPVQWVNRPDAKFRGFAGTLTAGSVSRGDRIVVQPGGRASSVRNIVTADGNLETAHAGQSIAIELTDEIDISRGDVITSPDNASLHLSPQIRAHVFWTGAMPAREAETYIIQLAGSQMQARLTRILHKIDIGSYEPTAADEIGANGFAAVTLRLSKALPFTDYEINRTLGGFILIDRYSNETVAIGLVEQSLPDVAMRQMAPEAKTGPLGTAKLRLEQISGVAGSQQRRDFLQRMSWRATSCALVAIIAGGVSGSVTAAIFAGLADLSVRPLMHRWHRAVWRSDRDQDRLNLDGGGI